MAKKVTIFGAGFVVKPMVDYLAKHGYEVLVSSRTVSKAEALAEPHPNVSAMQFNSSDDETMSKLVQESDLVVSMLPATMHVKVAKQCIMHKTNMVTTSYISPKMRELDQAAKDAGITVLNEIGVDPGIDHMSAMRIFHHVEDNGGKIVSFRSYCGGLPAPEANTNPMGYKFSWAPKGVLMAAMNGGTYLCDGEVVEVEGKNLFSHNWFVEVEGTGTFEAYINRNSLPYIDLYNLPHVKTMYRGTLRNVSHCETWYVLSQMGFFKDVVKFDNLDKLTIREFILIHVFKRNKTENLGKVLRKIYNLPEHSVILKKFEWMGFFDNKAMVPISSGSAVDVLTAIMLEKMPYLDGERDMLVMHHEFKAEFPDKEQFITSSIVDFGIPNGDSSMARTVSLPAAIATRMILEGTIAEKGVLMPVLREVYTPILKELDKMGIKINEKFKTL
ncbi:MAG: saccharopine dehydrogenase NADP-binding domain-containing protein [Candidatus Cloacimonetes bacterium]|nr:saccharopine dehydrogenase NADP-binding domain-containing protein [Candidatus Cloacimonadota bacterium]